MDNRLNILLIEDNPADAKLLDIYIHEAFAPGYLLVKAQTLSEGLAMDKNFDVIISDIFLPDSEGMDTIHPYI